MTNGPEPANSGGLVDAQNPWPGLLSYSEAASEYFHGRGQEIAALFRLVNVELVTLVFGQSGLGKTSLLLAGLFPELRRASFLPVYIRLKHGASDPELAAQILAAVAAAAEVAGLQFRAPQEGETLWEYFQGKDPAIVDSSGKEIAPVMVLDQFEEIFNEGRISDERRLRAQELLEEFECLAENRAPKSVRARLEKNSDDLAGFDFDRRGFRIVVSLREDFLPELEGIRDRFPGLVRNRFRVMRMTAAQALAVVCEPGYGLVSEEVARKIVEDMTGSKGLEKQNQVVEPALLSVVLRELNNRRLQSGAAIISAEMVSVSQASILRDFYENEFSDVPDSLRVVLEKQLLSESGRYRVQAALDDLVPSGVSEEWVAKLVKRRIIRYDERYGARVVELTHDRLVPLVFESREKRAAAFAAKRRTRTRLTVAVACMAVAFSVLVIGVIVSNEAARQRMVIIENGRVELVVRGNPAEAIKSLSKAYSAGESGSALRFLIHRAQELVIPSLPSQVQHTKGVYSASFSPDGSQIVTASKDGTAKIWYAADGRFLETLALRDKNGRANLQELTSASFDNTGTRVVTGGSDGTAQIWAVNNPQGPPLVCPDPSYKPVFPALFSPDGDQVLTASTALAAIIWDSHTGNSVKPFLSDHRGSIQFASYSTDGKWIVTASADQTVMVWNAQTHERVSPPMVHSGAVRCAVFSPDGERVASVDQNGRGYLWTRDGNLIAELKATGESKAHQDLARRAVFSPDGRRLVTTSRDGTAHVWDGVTGADFFPLLGHVTKKYVYMAAFSPDGTQLATAGEDGTAKLWDPFSGRLLANLAVGQDPVYSVAFDPSGSRLLTAGEDGIPRVWETSKPFGSRAVLDGKPRVASPGTLASVIKELVFRYKDSGEKSSERSSGPDLQNQNLYDAFQFSTSSVTKAHLSPNGTMVLTVDASGVALLWTKATQKNIPLPSGKNKSGATDAVFSPAGDRIAVGYKTGEVVLMDLSGVAQKTINAHPGGVGSVQFSTKANLIVTSGDDVTDRPDGSKESLPSVKGFDADSGTLQFTLPDCTRPVLSGDGLRLVALVTLVTLDAKFQEAKTHVVAKIIDLRQRSMPPITLDAGSWNIVTARFSPNGQSIVTASDEGTATIWDAATGTSPGHLPKKHTDALTFAAFSPDGKRVITTSKDNTAKIWDARRGEIIPTLEEIRGEGDMVFAVFNNDGSLIFTQSKSNSAEVWEAASGRLLARLNGHAKWLTTMELSADGESLLTGAQDHTARIWDVSTKAPPPSYIANFVAEKIH